MQDDSPPEKPKFRIQLIEWVAVFTILCFLAGILLPAVIQVRQMRGQPRLFEFLPLDLEEHIGLIIAIGGPLTFTLTLFLIRLFLPQWVQDIFPWWMSREEISAQNQRLKLPSPKLDARPPLYSFTIAAMGSLLLFVSACHFNVDRSRSRRAVITFVGPLGDYAPVVGNIGLCLSIAAIIAGVYVRLRYTSHRNWLADGSCALGFINLLLSFIFLGAAYES